MPSTHLETGKLASMIVFELAVALSLLSVEGDGSARQRTPARFPRAAVPMQLSQSESQSALPPVSLRAKAQRGKSSPIHSGREGFFTNARGEAETDQLPSQLAP